MIFLRRQLSVLIAASATLLANSAPEATSLSSASADYNGNTLTLKGNVVLDHGLGKMMAEQALLEKQEPGKDFPFSFIHLQKEVNVELPEQAALKCEIADLDFIALKGTLLPKLHEKVTYIDNHHRVRLLSDAIELEMQSQGMNGKKTNYELKNITCEGSVIIDYAQAFTLQAHRAFYDKAENRGIQAYPQDSESFCHLNHEGDEIRASQAHLDLEQARLTLQQASGKLLSSLIPHVDGSEISFRCDELVWDHLKNILSLKGNIAIQEPSIGTIQSAGVMHIAQAKIQGKRLLNSIRTQGKTILSYTDPTQQKPHQLISHGTLYLDREHLRIAVDSPQKAGKVPQGKQVHYTESQIAVLADRAVLEYALAGDTLQPVSLLLKGNVQISSSNEESPPLCGLADRIVFSPATKTLILSADPNKKVLFWDEAQGLRIASQEIHITEDPSTHQKAVKGVGNVRFAFSNDEDTLLNQIFPFYKATSHE